MFTRVPGSGLGPKSGSCRSTLASVVVASVLVASVLVASVVVASELASELASVTTTLI